METRQSRMDKYFEMVDSKNGQRRKDNGSIPSRTKRNQELYKKVSSLDIEDFDMNSNTTILGDNTNNINLDKIKEQLEEKYHESPRNKSFGDTDEINLPKINLDETREYDINAILAKAKAEKEVNYEEDRLKKVSEEQIDFIKDLEIAHSNGETFDKSNIVNKEDEEEIRELIDTITAKELIKQEEETKDVIADDIDPFDLLGDLKGDDDNTKVMGQLVEEVEAEMGSTIADEDEITSANIEELRKEIAKVEGINTESEEEEESAEEEDEPAEDEEETSEEVVEETKETKPSKKEKKKKELEDSFVNDTGKFSREDFDDFEKAFEPGTY